ncbi:MAG: T9SS type A sorting domain-containing protein [Ignavibacteria bacterium]|nr:T9SS type A sorting domain-containing protein [Ignavibacteria bacterium]
MKKVYRLNILVFSILAIALLFSFSAFNSGANTEVVFNSSVKHKNTNAELVKGMKNTGSFVGISLFKQSNKDNSEALNTFVNKASFFTIDVNALSELNSSKPETITLMLKGPNNKDIEAELVKVNPYPEGIKVRSIGNGQVKEENFNQGNFYSGIIKGDENSIVSLSVFENNVMGIFSTDNGNFVLGALKDDKKNLTSEYILYNDLDVITKPGFECGSGDAYDKFYRTPAHNSNNIGNAEATISPVDINFTCDYKMYQDNGSSATATAAFVSGVFLHVKTLYQNESITVNMVPSVSVYTSTDPYANLSGSDEILKAFGTRTKNAFTGDLAHLLSTGHGQLLGGIAWIRVLCQSYEPSSQSGRYAFSNIEGNYQPYPTYSWTVMVITHETGHNFGSMHTHACVWPTVSGQIDSCYQSEGACVTGTFANNNGTIMSYCHLNGAINLTRGFGSLPRDTINLRYNQALCLDNPLNSSEAPLFFSLLQNYPNPFNPVTNIKFALPEDGLVSLKIYDITGREIAILINSNYYPIGIFSYNLDANSLNLASGVYLYKLDVNRDNKSVYSEIKKMVLVK